MPDPFWVYEDTNPRQKKTYLLQLQPTAVAWATRSNKALAPVVTALRAGVPAEVPDPKLIDRADVRAVDYLEGDTWVRIRDAGGGSQRVFTAASADDAAAVVRDLAAGLSFPPTPSRSDASVAEVTKGPAILAGITLVLGGLMYFGAGQPDTGTRRYGRAGTIKWIAETLGQGGILAVGLLLIGLCVAYWLYQLKNPPAVFSYGEPMPTKRK
jgi:hypothetical protein